ncbi:MAG: hypothetical protein ACJAVY_002278, partial [Marinoscillum sp.]
MDDLKELWGEWKTIQSPEENISSKEVMNALHATSIGIIEKLRYKVKQRLIITIALTVLIAGFIPFAFPLASQILLSIMLLAYFFGSVMLWQEYQLISTDIDMTREVLRTLMTFHMRINRIIRYDEIIGLIVYPISATGGFLLGMQAHNRHAEIMHKPIHWVILIITTIAIS